MENSKCMLNKLLQLDATKNKSYKKDKLETHEIIKIKVQQ